MRLVLTALVALMLFSQVFARDIDLQGESVTVGPLAQQDFQTAHETINFIRTTDTPNELTLLYSLNVQVTVCVRYEVRPVLIPSHYENKCFPQNGTVVCRDVFVPAHYENQQVCVKTEERMSTDDKKLYLDFKKAQKLEGNEREVFSFDFNQEKVRNDKHSINVQKVEGAHDYDVKETTILGFKRTLKFKTK